MNPYRKKANKYEKYVISCSFLQQAIMLTYYLQRNLFRLLWKLFRRDFLGWVLLQLKWRQFWRPIAQEKASLQESHAISAKIHVRQRATTDEKSGSTSSQQAFQTTA